MEEEKKKREEEKKKQDEEAQALESVHSKLKDVRREGGRVGGWEGRKEGRREEGREGGAFLVAGLLLFSHSAAASHRLARRLLSPPLSLCSRLSVRAISPLFFPTPNHPAYALNSPFAPFSFQLPFLIRWDWPPRWRI